MADTQWEKLDGEASLVKTKGEKYQEIAAAIERASRSLQRIVDDTNTTAKSMDATRRLAGEVREDISKALDRYRYTGDALVTYAQALDPAVEQSATAATRLAELRADLVDAQARQSAAEDAVDDLPDDAPAADRESAGGDLTAANGAVSSIQGSITFWEGRWTDAKTDKDGAARTAKGKIDEVVTGEKVNGLEDSTWDKLKDVAKGLYKVFKLVCDVAGILAIFLSWVPILGQVLLVLAAIGALLTIIEGIVKIARDGFSWGALLGIGLGVLALFGGRAVGAVAKYAKARSVVQTTARMSPRAAKVTFGGSVIKSSRRTFAMTRGQRVTDVLKSPFVRSATDKKIAGMLTRGDRAGAWATWQGAKFPRPFKGGLERWALGNDEVVDMAKFFSQTGLHVDDVTVAAQSIAILGSVGHRTVDVGTKVYNFADSVGGGDGWKIAGATSSLVMTPAGGSWGTVTGLPMKVEGWTGS
jgi:hypothetical protein